MRLRDEERMGRRIIGGRQSGVQRGKSSFGRWALSEAVEPHVAWKGWGDEGWDLEMGMEKVCIVRV